MTIEMVEKLVMSWRISNAISSELEKAFETSLEKLYDVHGFILDVLCEYAHEKNIGAVKNLLKSGISNSDIAVQLCVQHDKAIGYRDPAVKQPTPKFFTDEQIARMQEVFGAYVSGGKK